jgi:hypothetical protein
MTFTITIDAMMLVWILLGALYLVFAIIMGRWGGNAAREANPNEHAAGPVLGFLSFVFAPVALVIFLLTWRPS